jgi:putative endonuclease
MPDAQNGVPWSVYVVRCRDGSLYTGIATDVARRLEEHRNGRIGARYLRGRAPLELAAQWSIGDRSLALRVEHRIKRMTRTEKDLLLATPDGITTILSRLERDAGCEPARAGEG